MYYVSITTLCFADNLRQLMALPIEGFRRFCCTRLRLSTVFYCF